MNIFDSLERAQIRFPDKDAVMFKGQRTTYGELYEQACRLSAALSKRFGLLRGDRVAIFLPNIPEFIVSYYAIEKLGAVAVSLNVMLKRNEVEFILRDCGARVLIAMAQFLEEVPENISSLEAIVTRRRDGPARLLAIFRAGDGAAGNGGARRAGRERRRRGYPLYLGYYGAAQRRFAHPRQPCLQLAGHPPSYAHDSRRPLAMFPASVSLLRAKLHHEHRGAGGGDAAPARTFRSRRDPGVGAGQQSHHVSWRARRLHSPARPSRYRKAICNRFAIIFPPRLPSP